GDSTSAGRAGGAALTAEPAALSPSATFGGTTATGGSPSGGVVALTPDVTGRLDDAIKQVMNRASLPGVIVGYTTPAGGYQRAFGAADKVAGTPMTPDLYTRIGSVTKTLTTSAVLRLADQGRLGLDDPVSKYVPNVPGGDGITLRQLGDMRSGLYNYTDDPDFQQALFSDPNRSFTPDQLLAYAFRHASNFAPDSKFEYSNTNAILLGQVVEKVGGQPLGDFLRTQVFAPAGLNRTVFPTDATIPDPHAHGYTNQTPNGSTQDATTWNPSWGWAAGAAISGLADLQSWSKVLATGMPLFNQATQTERLKFKDTGSPDVAYGFGLFNTHGWIGHNGSLPGYETVAVYLPAAQASLVVLVNTDTLYQGSEPSTLLAKAITQIVSPGNVYTLPATMAPSSTSTSAPPSPSASASVSGSSPASASPTAGGSAPAPTPGTTGGMTPSASLYLS
ncbi:serine hydrolase, partial [Streptomyces sp. FH025]|uniref:serine hydrolase domain-containing protein n=1 Tax=Streptomyces sp. FH025 TaxID=2815937 RepID=UPI001A9E13CA